MKKEKLVSHLRWKHGIPRNKAKKIRDLDKGCPYCLLSGSGIMSTGSEMDICFCRRKDNPIWVGGW